jgi:hydroxymethylglutaryl-CoA reductase
MDIFDHHKHMNQRFDELKAQLDLIMASITKQATQEHKDMTATDDAITALTAQVTANTTVIGSAEATISGIAAALATAIAAAAAGGATPAQLAQLTAMQTTLQNDDTGLATAITANTPAAP